MMRPTEALVADGRVVEWMATLDEPVAVVVEAHYRSALYLRAGSEWVVLLTQEQPIGPGGILLSHGLFGSEWPGQGRVIGNTIELDPWRVLVSDVLLADTSLATPASWERGSLTRIIQDVWPTQDVFSHLDAVYIRRVLREKVRNVITALETPYENSVEDAVRHLIGFGPGATPSGDDVLVGLIAGLNTVYPDGAECLKKAVPPKEELCHLTTIPSTVVLSKAQAGEVFSPLNDVLRALAGDSATMVNAVKGLVNRGHTSGKDMLAGVAIALTMTRTGGDRHEGGPEALLGIEWSGSKS